VGKMKVMRNGRLLCTGKGCHTIYDARDVIDPDNEEHAIYV
jgi:hypothetical protein